MRYSPLDGLLTVEQMIKNKDSQLSKEIWTCLSHCIEKYYRKNNL